MVDTPGEDFQRIDPDTWERSVKIGDGDFDCEVTVSVDYEGNLWLSLSQALDAVHTVVALPLGVIEGGEIAAAVWSASTYAARLRKAHGAPGTPPGSDSGA